MTPLEYKLLNNYQRGFPLNSRPFASIADDLGTTSTKVIDTLAALKDSGTVSRVGPVFRPNTVGVSTLAAMAIPVDSLEQVAAVISSYPEVNHNYEREHELNLWFVATASDKASLDSVLADMEARTNIEILKLPLLREYHIDLGFSFTPSHGNSGDTTARRVDTGSAVPLSNVSSDSEYEEELIAAIQSGLPLSERPYSVIANTIGIDEQGVIEKISGLQAAGKIRRLGVVVRHHELGFRSNGMLVWDIPDELVDEVGQSLSSVECVTLCYQRPRHLPSWPYNLFSMIHGKNREDVLSCIDDIVEKFELKQYQHDVLFSLRRFKQCGARYRKTRTDG